MAILELNLKSRLYPMLFSQSTRQIEFSGCFLRPASVRHSAAAMLTMNNKVRAIRPRGVYLQGGTEASVKVDVPAFTWNTQDHAAGVAPAP